jgi:hypothetical protein
MVVVLTGKPRCDRDDVFADINCRTTLIENLCQYLASPSLDSGARDASGQFVCLAATSART